jgi:hypothetical protein
LYSTGLFELDPAGCIPFLHAVPFGFFLYGYVYGEVTDTLQKTTLSPITVAFIYLYVIIVSTTLFVIWTVQTLEKMMSRDGLVLDLDEKRFSTWWSLDSNGLRLNKLARLLKRVYHILNILHSFLLPPALAVCFKNAGTLWTALQWLAVTEALVWAIVDTIFRFHSWP